MPDKNTVAGIVVIILGIILVIVVVDVLWKMFTGVLNTIGRVTNGLNTPTGTSLFKGICGIGVMLWGAKQLNKSNDPTAKALYNEAMVVGREMLQEAERELREQDGIQNTDPADWWKNGNNDDPFGRSKRGGLN